MNNKAFVQGEALAKLIELVGSDKKARVMRDAELADLIDDVREMFKSDELTTLTRGEMLETMSTYDLEPGHKYFISDDEAYVTASTGDTVEPYGIKSGEFVQVSNSLEYSAVSFGSTDDFIGTNTATSVANLPVDKSTIDVQISTNGTLSWESGLADGREVLCIIHNTGATDIDITMPENCNATIVEVKAGKYAEASVIAIAGTYYTRVAVDVVATSGGGQELEEITAEEVQAMFDNN